MTARRLIIYGLAVLASLALPLQAIIDPSIENIACACLVLASSLMVLIYIGCTDALKTQPLSTFSIFGFCVTTQLSALLFQTASWKPVSASLYDGMYTFGTLAFYQAIAIGVHAAYCFFKRPRPEGVHLVRGVLAWAGLYLTPSCRVLWLFGAIGLASYAVYVNEGLLASPLGKVGLAINFLSWAPFLIPSYRLEFGDSYCNWGRTRLWLVAYTAILVGLGVALNARVVMFFGVITVGLLYLLAGMRDDNPLPGRSVLRMGAIAAVAIVLAAPMSNLTTSMAIARRFGPAPILTKIERIIDVWQRPELIRAYRAEQVDAQRAKSYDEYYVANPIAARFVLTKYVDNSLHFGSLIVSEDAKSRLWNVSVKFLWAALPGPVLKTFGVPVDKDELNFSMGDYLSYLSHGDELGGHRMGVMFGQGNALLGPLLPFLFAVICLVMYGLMDLLTIKHATGLSTISALGMLQIWRFFNGGLMYEGLHSVFDFVIRNFWQIALIYVLVQSFARIVLPRNNWIGQTPSAPTWQGSP